MDIRDLISHNFKTLLNHLKDNCIEATELDSDDTLYEFYLFENDVFIHVPDWDRIYRVERAVTTLEPHVLHAVRDLLREEPNESRMIVAQNSHWEN